jgi:flagellar biosynthetic protein FliR
MRWVYTSILLSLRLGPILFLTPLMGTSYVPGAVKGLLTLGLSALMVLALEWSLPLPTSLGGLLSMLTELATGLFLAYGIQVAFGSLAFAGRLLDTQMGLGLAGMINPMSKQPSALFAVVLDLIAVAYVFAIDGHHLLMRTVMYSVEKLPLGGGWYGLTLTTIMTQFGLVFSLGLTLLAPVLLVLFFVEVGGALMARSMPQLNAFLLLIPAKIAIGLLLLALLLPSFNGILERWFTSILIFWDKVLL